MLHRELSIGSFELLDMNTQSASNMDASLLASLCSAWVDATAEERTGDLKMRAYEPTSVVFGVKSVESMSHF